ncbi:MAG: hypothetical protein GY865_06655 [candidate division Zixibacteria bacterium]|nr:hypothetical protein [candidate division Zixibacteria bacterium]
MEIKTSDLYCASYILSEGGRLKEVEVTQRDKNPCAEFVLIGDGVLKLETIFRSGKATVDLMSFQASLRHMKDMMFHALRKHELLKLQKNKFNI